MPQGGTRTDWGRTRVPGRNRTQTRRDMVALCACAIHGVIAPATNARSEVTSNSRVGRSGAGLELDDSEASVAGLLVVFAGEWPLRERAGKFATTLNSRTSGCSVADRIAPWLKCNRRSGCSGVRCRADRPLTSVIKGVFAFAPNIARKLVLCVTRGGSTQAAPPLTCASAVASGSRDSKTSS